MHRAALASLVMACVNCAGSSAAAPVTTSTAKPVSTGTLGDGPPLATPGEHMQYKLSLQGIDLASYDFAVGDITKPGDLGGKSVVAVLGHAKVTGLVSFLATIDDHFTSWVDITNGRPLRFQTDEYASGSRSKIEHTVVELAARTGSTVPLMFHVNAGAATPEPQLVTAPVVWDFNSFLLALRAWEAPAGTALGFEVFRSRWAWHVDVTMRGKDSLVTPLGKLPALRIDGRTYKLERNGARDAASVERTFSMWISDDDGRVPLEIRATTDYGDLRMQIVDYQPGTAARLRP